MRKWNSAKKLSMFMVSILLLCQCGMELELTKQELESGDKLLDKGRYYFAEAEYDLAIQVFKMVIDKFHSTDSYSASWAQYEIGMSHYLDDDEELAIEAFKEVLRRYPLPKQPRILASRLIQKLNRGDGYKRSTYFDNDED